MINYLTRGRSGKKPHPHNCTIKSVPTDEVVVSGLALTPSDIARMANDGIAVSVPNAEAFTYDNSEGWDIPPEFARDADRNQLWEMSKSARARILMARHKDKSKFE